MSDEAAATVFSLSNELPQAAAGASFADDSAFDAGVLVGHGVRRPCFIRKFTAAGATLRLMAPVGEGEQLTLELQNGQNIAGRIAWCMPEEVGFVFDARVDVVGTLARTLATRAAERRRMPRVELRTQVSLRHGPQVAFGQTRDISEAGVGIETRLPLKTGDLVQITFDGLRPLEGLVRWAQGGNCGIAFITELTWQTLMPWFRSIESLAPPPPSRATPFDDGESAFGLGADKRLIPLNAPARVREGTRWWNVHLRALTPEVVEFQSAALLKPGLALWVWLPHVGGWPARVTEVKGDRYLAEFRLALRPHELGLLMGGGRKPE